VFGGGGGLEPPKPRPGYVPADGTAFVCCVMLSAFCPFCLVQFLGAGVGRGGVGEKELGEDSGERDSV